MMRWIPLVLLAPFLLCTGGYNISRRTFLKGLAGLLASFLASSTGCVSVELRRGNVGEGGARISNAGLTGTADVQSGQWLQSTSADFQDGAHFKTRVVELDDGAVTLVAGAPEGTFTSSVKKTDFTFNAVGAVQNSRYPQGAAIDIEVRTSPNGADWSEWVALRSLKTTDSQEKDDDLTRTAMVKPGSYLQYRALFSSSGEAPILEDITITYLDSSHGPSMEEAKNALLPKAAGQPPIISRQGWGANEKLRFDTKGKEIWPSEYRKPEKMILHHTLTSNDQASAPAMVRAIYYYHAITLGWGDIGYHYLIDASGNIYEGRHGDGVVGGHTASHNYGSIGIAVLGNYNVDRVSDAAQKALGVLLSWLGDKYGIDPTGHSFFIDRDLPNICGHRDANQTSCPGNNLYDLLPNFRKPSVAATSTSVSTWYFAEGATTPGYDTWLLLLNPNATAAQATITFYDEAGNTSRTNVQISPRTRLNVFVDNIIQNKAVGMKVESNQTIYAERAMYFGHDGHSSTGASGPAQTWYFAEGSTQAPFDTWLLMLNPNGSPAHTKVSYFKPDGSVVVKSYEIAATSRRSIWVNPEMPNTPLSMKIESDAPIVAERSMFFDHGRGGHNTIGATSPSQTWYFAEGAVGSGFDTWILLLNPNAEPAQTTLTFLQENGQTKSASYTIAPRARLNVWVNQLVPAGGISTRVESNRPVVAERSMYWADARAGHNSMGATAPASQWFLPEGSTTSFNEWILVSNPNAQPAIVTLNLLDDHGNTTAQNYTVSGNTRLNIWVNKIAPSAAVSAIVQSDRPVVVERSSYTLDNQGGTNSMGIPR